MKGTNFKVRIDGITSAVFFVNDNYLLRAFLLVNDRMSYERRVKIRGLFVKDDYFLSFLS